MITTKQIWIYQVLAIVVTVMAILLISALPVEDGDLWWQMAYGRYMIAHHTIVPDHTIYSWTPATNDIIYCAWIAELLLYGAYQQFGLVGVSVFRYAAVLSPLLLIFLINRAASIRMTAPLCLFVFLCYLTSRHSGGLLKPELFSYILFTCLVALYFLIKSHGTTGTRYIYAIPALMLIWVNTHGAFVIGMAFLGIAFAGELLNLLFKSSQRLPVGQWKHVCATVPLTAIAICATPYGIRYPAQLLVNTLKGTHDASHSQVTAYASVFGPGFDLIEIPIYMVVILIILTPFFIESTKTRKTDFAIITLTVFLFAISSWFARLTYFFPIFMLFAFNHLCRESSMWKKVAGDLTILKRFSVLSIAIMVALAYHALLSRSIGDSRGPAFAAGYLNPESEVEYIKTQFPDLKICNGYNGGGYLLWKLWPDQKVMIDPRYFPYKSWYEDWKNMVRDPNPRNRIQKFECDLWLLNHTYSKMITSLVRMPDWVPVFVGTSGVVFVKAQLQERVGGIQVSRQVSTLRSLPRTGHVLNLLLQIREHEFALEVSAQAQNYWADTANQRKAENAHNFTRGSLAYYTGDYQLAYSLLKQVQQGPSVISNKTRSIEAGQLLTEKLWHEGDLNQAHNVASEVLTMDRSDIISLYNTGFLELAVARNGIATPGGKWKEYLNSFLEKSESNPAVPSLYLGYAREMLETGKPVRKPPLKPTSPAALTAKPQPRWSDL